jgi:acyl-CoA synthetase (NDP forming)
MKPFADLTRLVNPRAIAVVGASGRESSQGRRLYDNLALHSRFDGKIFAVNPAYSHIGQAPCWPALRDLPPADIDVALIIVNASLVLDALRQCAERGIPFAIVMTSGFAEAGQEGKELERQIAALCRDTGLHVYGPNCPGFVNIRDRIGMTFSPAFKDDLNSGAIGLATQGGGLGRNLLQGWSHGEGAGLWFSAGNEVDLELPDFIAHMAKDPQIRVIAVLMEGIKDGRRLAAALDMARRNGKPVAILKIGRSEAGVRAAQSHTASIAGSAEVNSAVFRQFGAIEVGDLHELVAVTRILAGPPPKPGTGLCVFAFSGGTAALGADIAGAAALPMALLSEATQASLRAALPDFAAVSNPVDTTTEIFRDPELARKCLRIACDDPDVGAVLFPIPMDYGPITESIARTIAEVSAQTDTIIIPVWMSRRMGTGFEVLEKGGRLPFLSISDAVSALKKILPPRPDGGEAAPAQAVIEPAPSQPSDAGARMITEAAAKDLLRKAGLPMPRGRVARSADEAAAQASEIGFPVVMKVVSADIPHKTEAGGVRLGVADADAARHAFDAIHDAVRAHAPHAAIAGVLVERMLPPGGREVLIGVHRDAAFGLVLTFGLGGIFVETLRDATHRMVPLSADDARAMIREIRYIDILHGVRGQAPADFNALEALVLQVSDYAHRHREALEELELNPVWVGVAGQGAVPLDALITLVSGPTAASL